MANEPEQPDLFEWKPASGFFSRLWRFLKSERFFWIVFKLLFIPLFIIDNFLFVIVPAIDDNLQLQSTLPFLFLTFIFFIIYFFKKPAVVWEHLSSVYFWIIVAAFGFFAFLDATDYARYFFYFLLEQWLLSVGVLIAILGFLLIKKPPYLLKLLKSKILWLILVFYILISLPAIQHYTVLPNTKYLMIPLGIALVIASLLAIWKFPLWLTQTLQVKKGSETQSEFEREEKRLKMVDDTRKTVATIIGGLFVIVGAVFTYSNYELSSEGQVTNRFSTAVVLLKDDDSSVRLGGLYALERIAKDSPKDHATIMEILAVYIRERSRLQREKADKTKSANANQNLPVNVAAEKDSNDNAAIADLNTNSVNSNTQANIPAVRKVIDQPAPVDILAAAEIIRRREQKNDRKESFFDLSNANLNEANLYGTSLNNVNLSKTSLRRVNFDNASLLSADFTNANLLGATFQNSTLIGAVFFDGYLNFAKFSDADLDSATFQLAIIENARFNRTNLRYTNFKGARLKDTDFSFAKLNLTVFENADLRGAKFFKTKIFNTSFIFANLDGADFEEAEMTDADFRNTDLRNCKNLTLEQIKLAIINEETRLPDHLAAQRSELLQLSKERVERNNNNSSF